MQTIVSLVSAGMGVALGAKVRWAVAGRPALALRVAGELEGVGERACRLGPDEERDLGARERHGVALIVDELRGRHAPRVPEQVSATC